MTRGFTLTDGLVVIAIVATIAAMLAPPFVRMTDRSMASEPSHVTGWRLYTAQHDGHWWVIGGEHHCHHPDCPCLSRVAEAE